MGAMNHLSPGGMHTGPDGGYGGSTYGDRMRIGGGQGGTPRQAAMQMRQAKEAPEVYFPNLGSNAGVLIRKDILAEKERSRSPSPHRERESDMSIGASLNPNLRKAKEDRIKYQRRFLNGEEGSGSEEDEEGKEKTKSKTVVMHFKRKAKDKGE